jgi:hypothetical protein
VSDANERDGLTSRELNYGAPVDPAVVFSAAFDVAQSRFKLTETRKNLVSVKRTLAEAKARVVRDGLRGSNDIARKAEIEEATKSEAREVEDAELMLLDAQAAYDTTKELLDTYWLYTQLRKEMRESEQDMWSASVGFVKDAEGEKGGGGG